MLKNFDHDLIIEEQKRLDGENEVCAHCHGEGGYWTGDGRNEPREWEACECQEQAVEDERTYQQEIRLR